MFGKNDFAEDLFCGSVREAPNVKGTIQMLGADAERRFDAIVRDRKIDGEFRLTSDRPSEFTREIVLCDTDTQSFDLRA